MMNKFINEPVVNWSRQALPRRVEVEFKYDSGFWKFFLIVAYTMLGIIFLSVPAMFLIGALKNFLTQGWSESVSGGLAFGGISLVVFGSLFAATVFFPIMSRRKVIRFLDRDGVETRAGGK